LLIPPLVNRLDVPEKCINGFIPCKEYENPYLASFIIGNVSENLIDKYKSFLNVNEEIYDKPKYRCDKEPVLTLRRIQ
jgi:hypothetical protein